MTERKKVFVSVPMNGKEDAVIERAIQLARVQYCRINHVDPKEVTFVDSFHDLYKTFSERAVEEINSVKYPRVNWLGGAIGLLSECDEVVFGIYWERSKGCRIEHEVAKEYGIPMICITTEKQKELRDELRKEKIEEVKEMKNKGMSNAEIAEKTKFPESTIRKWLTE